MLHISSVGICSPGDSIIYFETISDSHVASPDTILSKQDFTRKKIIASFLALGLGHFGMHRLYLGTKPAVVGFYVITLGGGLGILPLIDMILIITAKDLTPYMNNGRVFMWGK